MAKNFTLNHTIARPISIHHHKPTAMLFQHAGLLGSIAFMAILAWLLHLAYTTLRGAPLSILLAVVLPIKAAIILLAFFLYYKTTFRRELSILRRKHKLKIEHSFKHK